MSRAELPGWCPLATRGHWALEIANLRTETHCNCKIQTKFCRHGMIKRFYSITIRVFGLHGEVIIFEHIGYIKCYENQFHLTFFSNIVLKIWLLENLYGSRCISIRAGQWVSECSPLTWGINLTGGFIRNANSWAGNPGGEAQPSEFL